MLGESTTIVEYLDGFGDAAAGAGDAAAALQARLWDRVLDGQVATPMQKIVGDSLRRRTAATRRASSRRTRSWRGRTRCWMRIWPTSGGRRAAFTLADCAAAPALHYARVVHRWDESALPQLTRYFTA